MRWKDLGRAVRLGKGAGRSRGGREGEREDAAGEGRGAGGGAQRPPLRAPGGRTGSRVAERTSARGGGQAAPRYEDASEMSSPRGAVHAPLRRSLSEQLRDSTARAWDLLWRNVRERRLAGRCPGALGAGSSMVPDSWAARGPQGPPSLGRKGKAGGCVPDWRFHVAHPLSAGEGGAIL